MFFNWYFGNIDSSKQENPTYSFNTSEPCSTIPILLIAETQFGCVDSTKKNYSCFAGNLTFYMPNTFTPDDDGINDILTPKFEDLSTEDYSFEIFDRWGKLLFKTDKIDNGWDGTYEGQPVKQDVYVWRIKAKEFCGEVTTKEFKGHVSLFK